VTRGIAFTIDAVIVNVIAVEMAAAAALILSALSLPDSLNTVLVAAELGFLLWSAAYFVTFWSSTGQTAGNRVMQIRVMRAADGAVLRPRQSLVRLAGVMLAALPLFLGFLPILLNKRRRGLHDMIAGSVVVGAAAPGTGVGARAPWFSRGLDRNLPPGDPGVAAVIGRAARTQSTKPLTPLTAR
jgi:uncharacterized RDD family membrane protein YckC